MRAQELKTFLQGDSNTDRLILLRVQQDHEKRKMLLQFHVKPGTDNERLICAWSRTRLARVKTQLTGLVSELCRFWGSRS